MDMQKIIESITANLVKLLGRAQNSFMYYCLVVDDKEEKKRLRSIRKAYNALDDLYNGFSEEQLLRDRARKRGYSEKQADSSVTYKRKHERWNLHICRGNPLLEDWVSQYLEMSVINCEKYGTPVIQSEILEHLYGYATDDQLIAIDSAIGRNLDAANAFHRIRQLVHHAIEDNFEAVNLGREEMTEC